MHYRLHVTDLTSSTIVLLPTSSGSSLVIHDIADELEFSVIS